MVSSALPRKGPRAGGGPVDGCPGQGGILETAAEVGRASCWLRCSYGFHLVHADLGGPESSSALHVTIPPKIVGAKALRDVPTSSTNIVLKGFKKRRPSGRGLEVAREGVPEVGPPLIRYRRYLDGVPSDSVGGSPTSLLNWAPRRRSVGGFCPWDPGQMRLLLFPRYSVLMS